MNRPSIQTICFLISLCLSLPYMLKAQNVDYKEIFLEAESYFLYEEFIEALPLYTQLKEKFPENFNIDYKIGRCYLNMPYDKAKAISHLEKAVKHIAPVTKESNFKELNAPFDALFYLGDAYRINNQLDKAIETYQSFKKTANQETYKVELIDDQIEACKRAKELKKKPVDIDEENIGNIINTRYSETNPVVSHDENLIIYASRLPFYQAMFYSRKVDGKWTSPVNMIPELGVDGDCFPTSISGDGTELYVYRSNEYLGDIFVTNYKNGRWTKLRKLNSHVNTKYWESHACISSDGKTLYFTSNRDGSYGGLDIYKSERTTGDNWGPAVNLGPIINSEYNDDAPFLNADGSKLYFSSFGHETVGGYDFFVSEKNANGKWTTPKNFGFPVNSPDDELFLFPLRDGTIAYTSVYDPKGYGKFDIKRIAIYTAQHPRKYYVKSTIKLPEGISLTDSHIVYALYDNKNKDTIFIKPVNATEIDFETVPGNYNIIVKGNNIDTQTFPLNIAYGSKDIQREIALKVNEKKLIAENKNEASLNTTNKSENSLLADISSTSSSDVKDKTNKNNNLANSKNTQSEQENNSELVPNKNQVSIDQNSETSAATDKEEASSQEKNPKINGKGRAIIPISGIGVFAILFITLLLLRKKKKSKESSNTNIKNNEA